MKVPFCKQDPRIFIRTWIYYKQNLDKNVRFGKENQNDYFLIIKENVERAKLFRLNLRQENNKISMTIMRIIRIM